MIRSAAAGVGNLLVLMGARTGRDGIGGASVLASAELSEEDSSKRPERADRRPVRGEEAARVLSRAARARRCSWRSRTWARRGSPRARRRWPRRAASGSTSTCPRVPLREADMEPFEIMISESQERMLCVVEPAAARRSCSRPASAGRCAPPPSARSPTRERLRVFDGDELVGDMPVAALVDDCPLYDLEPAPPVGARSTRTRRRGSSRTQVPRTRCSPCSGRRTSASKRFAFEQYDSIVGSRTVQAAGDRGRGRSPARRRTAAPARSRSRSTATAAAWLAIPTPARSRPCSSARATSPASAPSRSASPTA